MLDNPDANVVDGALSALAKATTVYDLVLLRNAAISAATTRVVTARADWQVCEDSAEKLAADDQAPGWGPNPRLSRCPVGGALG